MAFTDYKTILEQTARLLPVDCQVVLLADRGFVDVKLFRLARDLGCRQPEALSRLFLILATATLYLVNSGVAVVTSRQRHQVDTHRHRGLSYLQLGWRWARYALSHGKRLFTSLWLRAGPDPEPVFASNKQAAQPIASLPAIRLQNGVYLTVETSHQHGSQEIGKNSSMGTRIAICPQV